MRISQVVIVAINIVLLLIGITILVVKYSTPCFSILYGALITLAPMLIVLSILGFLGVCCNSPFLLWLYLLLKLVIIVMIATGVFLDTLIMGRGFFQAEMTPTWNGAVDRLSDYSHWLRYQVVGISDWSHVKECLIHKDICFVTAKESYIFWETNNRLFGQHRSGCCNPPTGCDTKQNGNSTNPDCSAWSSDKDKMCYNCESCKTEFLADLTLVWGEMFPVIAALHIVLIVLFTVSCQAFRRARTAHYEKQYSYAKDVHPPNLDNIP